MTSMVRDEKSFQLLYASRLAPERTWEVMKEVADAARRNNPAHGITGALLFDGERFCQLIEGEKAAVHALMDNIASDARHSDVKLLFAGMAQQGRVTQRWASGYCDAHELEAFGRAPGSGDRSVLETFLSLLRRADID